MNPTLGLGERWSISNNDLLVMEAIGWDVNLYNRVRFTSFVDNAQSQVKQLGLQTRTTDVDHVLHTEAYNWS